MNNEQYGIDFFFDTDILFTDDDVRTQSGPALVAQDIKRDTTFPRGSLPWDTHAGSTIPHALGAPDTSPQTMQAELTRIARNDPRIKPQSVSTSYNPAQRTITLRFTPLHKVEPQTLTFTQERTA